MFLRGRLLSQDPKTEAEASWKEMVENISGKEKHKRNTQRNKRIPATKKFGVI